MKNIAIFASGSGTNTENIIKYFDKIDKINVKLIVSNNSNAFVLERAKKFNIKAVVYNKNDFYFSTRLADDLEKENIDIVVLAGFLWLIPDNLIRRMDEKIINIHPALLPKYGGKGMYGKKVHECVYHNKEKESGISIHYVNEKYDEGKIIAQYKCEINENDSPESIEQKVHELEYKYYPKVIHELLK